MKGGPQVVCAVQLDISSTEHLWEGQVRQYWLGLGPVCDLLAANTTIGWADKVASIIIFFIHKSQVQTIPFVSVISKMKTFWHIKYPMRNALFFFIGKVE